MVHLICIGVGYGSGWVTDIEFKKFMQHFIKHVKPSNEYKVLLILDNHSSHLHFETLNLAKENGIVWIQCQDCNQWSHTKCDSHVSLNYICICIFVLTTKWTLKTNIKCLVIILFIILTSFVKKCPKKLCLIL